MKHRKFVFLPILILLFFLFEYVGWFSPIRALDNKFLIPIYKFHNQLIHKAKAPYDFVLFSFSKFRYMNQLESRYVKSLSELSELDKLREENIELKKLIENRDVKIEKTIISSPVVSLAYPAVGVGSIAGVEVDDMVLISGMLVGTIDEVGNYQSKVSLLSKPRKNKVLVKTESGVEGIIGGDGKNILLTQVPRDLDLVNGERVVAVGQKGIERNTFVGLLRTIDNNPSAPTQTAIITQDVTFYDSILVEVK
jgi:cell shape-determining protein MreC